MQDTKTPKLKWKENCICYKSGNKGHPAQECPYTGNSAIVQKQQIPVANTQQASFTHLTLIPAIKPTFSLTTTIEIAITDQI